MQTNGHLFSEVIQDTYTIPAFGIQESSTGTSVNPFRFCGQWGYYDDSACDSGYGFLLLGVRYYWPEYGRFLTWDPLRNVNPYAYVGQSPTALIDPDGLQERQPTITSVIIRGDCRDSARDARDRCYEQCADRIGQAIIIGIGGLIGKGGGGGGVIGGGIVGDRIHDIGVQNCRNRCDTSYREELSRCEASFDWNNRPPPVGPPSLSEFCLGWATKYCWLHRPSDPNCIKAISERCLRNRGVRP